MQNVSKIIIWGMGITGQACAEYLIHQGKELILVDRKDPSQWINNFQNLPSVTMLSEDHVTLEFIKKYPIDYILASPGIDLRKGLIYHIKELGIPIIGDIEFVSLHTNIPIIAVTGTNGKSTTVNMIKSALEIAGKKIFLGGNWGIPAIKALTTQSEIPYDWLVLETSSFQLELTKTFSPQIAVITNITMSHAERYDDFYSYLKAKLQIINCSFDKVSHVILPKKQRDLFYPHLENSPKLQHFFDVKDLEFFDFSKVKVLGAHNLENFAATYNVLKAINLENKDDVMQKLIDTFSGIPHRLERVARWNEIYFFNDSKSTNIESTKTALSSFTKYLPHHPVVLLLGGKLRSEDVSFLDQLQDFSKISLVLSFGESSQKIKQRIGRWSKVQAFKDVSEIMLYIEKHFRADPHQKLIILFSPSFPSFDQFKNFEHRGEVFKMEVQALIQRLPKEN